MFIKQTKSIIGLTVIVIFLLSFSTTIEQVKADYKIRPGNSFKFYIETLKQPNGANHFINYRGLFIHAGVTLQVKILELNPIIKYTLTVDLISINTVLFTDIFVQETNWEELTIEYQSLGYEIVETDKTWGVRLNSSTIIEIDFNKKDGVVENFYAYNESLLVDYLLTGELYFYRTSSFTGLKWPYSFLLVIPIGGIIIYAIIYKRKISLKEKMIEED